MRSMIVYSVVPATTSSTHTYTTQEVTVQSRSKSKVAAGEFLVRRDENIFSFSCKGSHWAVKSMRLVNEATKLAFYRKVSQPRSSKEPDARSRSPKGLALASVF
jgi:hypothetical protein